MTRAILLLALLLTACTPYHADTVRAVVELLRGAGALGPRILP